jgi:radical SAM superfamily enzyme YgiQ (UPF0313 family)
MKVLLVVKSKAIETLGVMYLSAVVKKAGHECRIVEIGVAEAIAAFWLPDMIGYSVMTGDQELVKGLNISICGRWPAGKRLPLRIVGGPHPTFFPDDFRDNEIVSYPVLAGEPQFNEIIRGEAETWFSLDLGGQPFPDIDSIPWPDRTDFPDRPIRDFIASRGCVGKCAYCFNDQWAKLFPEIPRIRIRNPEDVVNEVASVRPQFAYFQDSCFGIWSDWMKEFSRIYAEKCRIPYLCHLRPGQVNTEMVGLLRESCCVSVKMALETASNRLRALIGRQNMTVGEIADAAALLKEAGIALCLQSMIGLPDSDIEDDLETLALNIRCQPAYAWVSIFQPYPGTALGRFCQENDWYDGDYSEIGDNFFDQSVLNFSDERKEQLACLQKCFALCSEAGYLPAPEELTMANFPKLIHKITRMQGDRRLFPGVL